MRSFILAAATLGVATSFVSAAISNPHIAGSFQSPVVWQPGTTPMADPEMDGIWTHSISGLTPGSRHEFKVTDGSWANTFPGPNSWFVADAAGNALITYDTNVYADGWSPSTERLGVVGAALSWTAAGNFQSEAGNFAGDWDNASLVTAMFPQGGGVYSIDLYPGAGTWEGKPVRTGSWDSISTDGRSINTGNIQFTLGANEFARMQVDEVRGVARVQVLVIPEPASLSLLGLAGLALVRRTRRA